MKIYREMTYGDDLMPERFWQKVIPEPNSGCWLWSGATGRKGYGSWHFLGKTRQAHRSVLVAATGDNPKLYALHRCNTSACVNPDHLYWGSQSENLRDQVADGVHPMANRTHCKRGHELTPENTYVPPSQPVRRCRTCVRAACRLSKRRARA